MAILKVDDLPFPVLLGRDAPDFKVLLQRAMEPAAVTVSKEDSTKETNRVDDEEGLLSGATGWSTDPAFQAAQENDPSLDTACKSLAVKETEIVDPRWAGRLPHFKKVRGVL